MKNRLKIITLILLSVFPFAGVAQHWQPYAGLGLGVLSLPGQNDFKTKTPVYMLQLAARRSRIGIQVNYHTGGRYQKNEFSFRLNSCELAFTFHPMGKPVSHRINPYLGIAGSFVISKFTTEGYPGITDYMLKIEKDKGPGVSLLAGAEFPVGRILTGLQLRYDKNAKAQFIAGGFSPQDLITDRFNLLITAAIPLHIKTRGSQNACPEF